MKLAPTTKAAFKFTCLGMILGIIICQFVQYAIDSYNRNGYTNGYKAGQIDYKKGKKCFRLIETNTGEVIYEKIDTCDYEHKKVATK